MEFLQTELEVTLPLQTCAVVVRNTKHQVKMSSYLEIDITKSQAKQQVNIYICF